MLVGAMPGGFRHRHVPAAAAILCAATALAVRLAVLPPPPMDAVALPDGDGPWRAVVVATGAPREGQPVATIELIDRRPAGSDLPRRSPATRSSRPASGSSLTDASEPRPDVDYGAYLERTGVAGTIRRAALELEPGPVEPARRPGSHSSGRGGGARARPARARGRARGRDPDRASRPRRPRARRGLHGGRREPRRRDLRLEHRDRCGRVAALGGTLGRRRRSSLTCSRSSPTSASPGRRRRSFARQRWPAWSCSRARPGVRDGRRRPRLGGRAAAARDPALIADAGFQLSSLATAGLVAWATPLWTNWSARRRTRAQWLGVRLGVSLAAQAATLPVVLASFGRLACSRPRPTWASSRSCRSPWRRRRGARRGDLAEAGVPAAIAAVLAFPAGSRCTIMVAIARFAAIAARERDARAAVEPRGSARERRSHCSRGWRRRRPRRPLAPAAGTPRRHVAGQEPAAHARQSVGAPDPRSPSLRWRRRSS